ncbi:baseplate hub protein [Caulobacter henricii]|uniref:Bacteriophage phiJL001 Gp84 C-terminal domain-containing protein n=1 Tax=Caulobacter henricii TaxID=69395 RepID=A0A0N7JH72_9CAUL|nr:DUF2163 domain-containing protein [Caulobacter henricii]ALL12586.1 hypothetical protein AQ619_03995 [Caulobacter henricii]
MLAVPTDLAERLDSDAASLCQAWILTRADGAVLGFTDHDRDLVVDGVTCRAATGWTAGAFEAAAGFAPGLSAALGALDDGALSEADIVAGLYDGARVACLRVDWRRPDLVVRLWTARIASLRREGAIFTAALEGPLADLERVAGRTYGRLCDVVLGDSRCGITPAPGAACDKRWTTCVQTFANGLNFRGFPTLPGEDFLTLYPTEGERHDGGRR